jgi:hypothetical protein
LTRRYFLNTLKRFGSRGVGRVKVGAVEQAIMLFASDKLRYGISNGSGVNA